MGLMEDYEGWYMHNQPKDLRLRATPCKPDNWWNYPRDAGVRKFLARLKNNNMGALTLISGPYGAGKTVAATYAGMWGSCALWKERPLPCGECAQCRSVRFGVEQWRGGFFELRCSSTTTWKEVNKAWVWVRANPFEDRSPMFGAYVDSPRPGVVLFDEVHNLPKVIQHGMLEDLKDWTRTVIIMTTTDPQKLDYGLVSRATRFEFTLPTVGEAARHLVRVAKEFLEVVLLPEVAYQISERCAGQPRDCLDCLNQLSHRQGQTIDLRLWQEISGEGPEENLDEEPSRF